MRPSLRPSLALLASLSLACPQPEPEPEQPTPDPGPYPEHCRDVAFDGVLTEVRVDDLEGSYTGVFDGMPEGTLYTMKVIPQQPFELTGIRAAFEGPEGPIRLRLTADFGRSYPDLDADLIDPIEAELADEDVDHHFIGFDVPEQTVFLEPTWHYILMAEQVAGGPVLAVESLPEGGISHAMMHVPGEELAYGLDGNFRLEMEGNYFCEIAAGERWFAEEVEPAFAAVPSARATVTDLDGDLHDDLVLNDGHPVAFLGDGAGGFEPVAWDPFPDAPRASMLVFADVDNDGDEDAFASTYVGADDDGDGIAKTEGDCDDADPEVSPEQAEVEDNGRDDDCDLVADSGTDDADADADGFSIAQGDCNDVRADVLPGGEELLDGRDNDCDGDADEIWVNLVLLNDGNGAFAELEDAGVETLDPSTAAAFADADEDGVLDLYWGNWLRHYPDDAAVQDVFVVGLGGGRFEEALAESGMELATPLSVYGVLWNDWNDDGAQDLYVANYHLYANQLWRNDGTAHFVDVAEEVGAAHDDIEAPFPMNLTYTGGHSYGGDFGDVDNDGDWDFYLCNLAHPRVQPWSDPSMFLVNDGAPGFAFANLPREYGFIYDEGDVNAAFADYDNDMDVDLVVASLYTGHYSRLYRNDGGDWFTDVTWESGAAVHDAVSSVWSDFDEDGDMDLVIADREGLPNVHLFVNEVGQERGWIELVLQGTATNRDAIGAKVVLSAGGVTQMREVRGGGGHAGNQGSRVVHFGLGDATSIDEVTVRWVGGAQETIEGLAPRGRYRVVEGSGVGEPIGE